MIRKEGIKIKWRTSWQEWVSENGRFKITGSSNAYTLLDTRNGTKRTFTTCNVAKDIAEDIESRERERKRRIASKTPTRRKR